MAHHHLANFGTDFGTKWPGNKGTHQTWIPATGYHPPGCRRGKSYRPAPSGQGFPRQIVLKYKRDVLTSRSLYGSQVLCLSERSTWGLSFWLGAVEATQLCQALPSVSSSAAGVKPAVNDVNVPTVLIDIKSRYNHEIRQDHATFSIDGYTIHLHGMYISLTGAGNVYYQS